MGSASAAQAYLEHATPIPKVRCTPRRATQVYIRDGQEGRKLRHHFCPECGTIVCWTGEKFPDLYGIVVCAFADPTFPAPTVAVFEEAMHP